MGFVRVGAVIVNAAAPACDNDGGGGKAAKTPMGKVATGGGGGSGDKEWVPKGSGGSAGDKGSASGAGKKRKSIGGAPKSQWCASPHTEYRSSTSDEVVSDVAAALGVSVFDFLFLNAAKYPKLTATSTLKKDAKYLVPTPPNLEAVKAEAAASHDTWHTVTEDTPFKKVAEDIGVSARSRHRLAGTTMRPPPAHPCYCLTPRLTSRLTSRLAPRLTPRLLPSPCLTRLRWILASCCS